jgi:hypothetical protein
MEVVLVLKTKPLENTLVTSRTVTCLAGKHEVVRGIVATTIDRNEMISGEIVRGPAEDTGLWEFLLTFPFPDGV